MRLAFRPLIRSSFIASLISAGLWYACPAAAADAPPLSVTRPAEKPNGGEAPRPEIKWTPPEKNVLVPEPPAPEVKAQNEDYYSRRARKILEAERTAGTSVHPLALANPDQQPVICDAGCREENKAEVVFSSPKVAPKTTVVGQMVPTSASTADDKQAGAQNAAASIDCIAGCYEGEKSWPARPQRVKVSAAAAPSGTTAAAPAVETPAGGWSTSIAREPVRDHLSPVR